MTSEPFNLYAELQGQAIWPVGPARVIPPADDCHGPEGLTDDYFENDDPDEVRH